MLYSKRFVVNKFKKSYCNINYMAEQILINCLEILYFCKRKPVKQTFNISNLNLIRDAIPFLLKVLFYKQDIPQFKLCE